jgi:hypothetical protein
LKIILLKKISIVFIMHVRHKNLISPQEKVNQKIINAGINLGKIRQDTKE